MCVNVPHRVIYGFEPYATLIEKAAALYSEIAKLHPFVDGNKRTAHLASVIFLELNGYLFNPKTDEAIRMAVETAICNIDVQELASWISNNTIRDFFTIS